jgi:hypothetical protein
MKAMTQAASAGQQLMMPTVPHATALLGRAMAPQPHHLILLLMICALTAREAGDDYMHWRIAKGGNFAPFNSSMPAWEGMS